MRALQQEPCLQALLQARTDLYEVLYNMRSRWPFLRYTVCEETVRFEYSYGRKTSERDSQDVPDIEIEVGRNFKIVQTEYRPGTLSFTAQIK